MIETYIPLYRKYRPQQFSDLMGQDVVSTAIGNALQLHKISHAYLFCGPRGTGKTSSARIFAKSLNCAEGPTPTPCQVCPSCMGITQGTALDVTEIDAASNNGVENIREITDKVQFSALQGKFKIFIIDEVHMLSTAAFNALLKTLEEPPPNVVFIFATTEPHKVLPTIISRCQRFDFSRITRQQIEARIAYVAQQEQIEISPEAGALIARHARGGLRDALGLLDQVAVLGRSGSGQAIQTEDVRSFIGLMEEDLVFDLMQGVIDKDPEAILMQVQRLQERGIEPTQMVKELTQHLRNLLIAKTCGAQAQGDQFDIPPDLYTRLCQQTQALETEEIPQMLSRLSQMEYQLKNSQQPQLWFEVGLLDLAYRQEIVVIKQLAERIHQLEQQLQTGSIAPAPTTRQPASPSAASRPKPAAVVPSPQPTPVVQPSAPPEARSPMSTPTQETPPPKPPSVEAAPVSVPPEAIEGPTGGQNIGPIWSRIVEAIQHLPTRSLVTGHFSLLEIEENSLKIGFSNDTIYETFRMMPKKMESLEAAVQAVLGKPYKLNFVLKSNAGNTPTFAVPTSEPGPLFETPKAIVEPPPSLARDMATLENLPEQESAPVAVSGTATATLTQDPPKASAPDLSTLSAADFEIEQAKKYTRELLQGKLLD